MSRSSLDEFSKGRIYEARREGRSLANIADEFRCSPQTVANIYKQVEENGNVKRKKGSGRKRATTVEEDELILHEHEKNWNATLDQLKSNLGLKVHKTTIKNRLNENGIFSFPSTKKPKITEENRKKRLIWANEHKRWGYRRWSRCLFSDETSFCINSTYPKRVWRKENQSLHSQAITPTTKFNKKLMIYGCFCTYGQGLLKKIDGNMDAKMYQTILNNITLPSAENLFNNHTNKWILVQDNDSKHSAASTKEWLNLNGVEVMKWPPQSPDLNPIENLWSHIKQRMKHDSSSTIDELYLKVDKEWSHVNQNVRTNLIKSMKKRCIEVIKQKGGPISY